jgi:hypothetical protein
VLQIGAGVPAQQNICRNEISLKQHCKQQRFIRPKVCPKRNGKKILSPVHTKIVQIV